MVGGTGSRTEKAKAPIRLPGKSGVVIGFSGPVENDPGSALLGQLLDMEGAQGKFHRDLLTAKQIDQGQNIDAQTAPRQKRPFQLPSKKLGIRALANAFRKL